MNKLLIPKPNFGLIGHRGTAGLRPENTYSSFKNAANLGLNWIEFDVQLCKDNQWVVMHDDTIDRTTNRKGRVVDYTLEELSQIEAGLWYNPPYPYEPIPSLTNTLLLCHSFGLQANIEIKGSKAEPEKYAVAMRKFLLANQNTEYIPMLSSFDLPCIIELRKLLPDQPIAYLVDYFTPDTIKIAKQHNFNSINCDVKHVDQNYLRLATESKIPVLLYTINDPQLAKQWFAAGVTAIFTDRPDLLLKP